jgi:AcrR family transcriptional regulator
MLKALLEADEPLSNRELIERADVSRKTLYRRIDDLQALAIVEQDDGGNWRLFIEPWWAAEADTDEPYLKATEAMRTAFTQDFPEDLLYEIAIQRGGDTLNKIHEIPWSDREEVLAGVANSIPWLSGWIPFVVALLQEPPTDVDPRDREVVVHLGDPTALPDPKQTTLSGGSIAV